MDEVRAVPVSPVAAARLPVIDRWWAAVSGGRFFTWWSAIIALPVAATVLGSFGGVSGPGQAAAAVALSAAGWLICCLVILPAAWAERRIPRPAGRAIVVIAALVLISVLRPVLNDLLTGWWTPRVVGGTLGLRILVNLIAWFLLFSMVGVAVNATAAAAVVNRRLRTALLALARGDAQREEDVRRVRARIRTAVDGLRLRAESLRTGTVDFERVREFSAAVRKASHDLDAEAQTEGAIATAAGEIATRPSFLELLRPPPPGLVGGAFTLSSLPYAFSIMQMWGVVAAAAAVMGVTLLGDLTARVLSRGRAPRVKGALVIAVAAGAGVALSLLFLPIIGSLGSEWLIPAAVLPGVTTLAAIAQGAIERAEDEQRSLTQALSAFRTVDRSPSPEGLLHAAATVLHGEVQSRCVVFAARLEDESATPAQTAEFIASVGARLDRVLTPTAAESEDALAALIAAWSPVLDIRCHIDDAAARALTDPDTARRVVQIASEAFVNAVKHSASREATVVVELVAPGMLAARIAAPGRLQSTRNGGLGLARLAVPARLSQRGGDVVLTATVPCQESGATSVHD